jgi:hypothetical protein
MTEDFEKHKWIFEPDGSLLDIYVQETNLNDWLKLIDFLNTNYKLTFGPTYENEPDDFINKERVINYLLDTSGEVYGNSVSILANGLVINCHFFLADEIEFDLDPSEFKGQQDFDDLITFLQNISKQLDKPIILTPQSSPKTHLISIYSRTNTLKITTENELKEHHKNSFSWLGRIRGFYTFGLLNLTSKLSNSKLKNYIINYIIGLTGADKPHVATKKSLDS